MQSLIKETLYAGLGLLGEGTAAVKNLGEQLAKKAGVTEAEGEKIARRFQAQSSKAVKSIRKTLDDEVTKFADAIHSAIRESAPPKKAKKSTKRASAMKTSANKVSKGKATRRRGKTKRVR